MIPKIVHYSWVGGEIPARVKENINHWREVLPDYEFIGWNEDNWDIQQSEFSRIMYQRRKYSFVVDAIRVDVLDRMGGIYLDTDVNVYNSFDSLLNHPLVLGRLYNNALGTAVILSEKNNPNINNIHKMYDQLTPKIFDNSGFDLVNNGIFTRYFLNDDFNFQFGNKQQLLNDGTLVLPKQAFEITAFPFEKNTFSTHEAIGSWRATSSKAGIEEKARFFARLVIPHALRARIFNIYCGRKDSIAKEYGRKRRV